MNNSLRGGTGYDNTMNILNRQLTDISVDNQYLSFTIGEEEYAVEVLLVQEIIRYTKPTRIPNSPPVIKGVLNFRGKVIPIIDMRKKFGLDEREYDSFTIIIVLEVRSKTMGIIVDGVSDVISFSPEDIQPADEELGSEIKVEHVQGLGKLGDGRLIQILAVDKLLSLEELVTMYKAKQKGTELQEAESDAEGTCRQGEEQ